MGLTKAEPIERGRPERFHVTATRTVAVIMAARRASAFIEEAVDSVRRARLPNGWRLELRIGVDECEETAAQLRALGVPYYWSAKRVGPYRMRNALVGVGQAEAYAIFDADDRMGSKYFEALLRLAGEHGIAGGGRLRISAEGIRLGRGLPLQFHSGVCVISHAAWERLGGYKAWPLAADYDLIMRARRMRIPVRSHPVAVYERREHPDALSRQERFASARERAKLEADRASGVPVKALGTELVRYEPKPQPEGAKT